MASAVASSPRRPMATPARSQMSVLRNWSAAWGRHSCGIPPARAANIVPEPAWETTTVTWGNSRLWPTYSVTWTFAGGVPKVSTSPPGPTVTTSSTSSAAIPSTARGNVGFTLKAVPNVR